MRSAQKSGKAGREWPFKVGDGSPPPASSPALLRTLLAAHGPMVEQELAQAAGLDNPTLVRALLKLDLCVQKVQIVDGRYQIFPAPDPLEHSRIQEATRFLEARGFVISRKTDAQPQL